MVPHHRLARPSRVRDLEGRDQLVTLNHDNPDVQAQVVRVMRHWLDRGADAWRLDAAYAVPTHFWTHVRLLGFVWVAGSY